MKKNSTKKSRGNCKLAMFITLKIGPNGRRSEDEKIILNNYQTKSNRQRKLGYFADWILEGRQIPKIFFRNIFINILR